MVAVISNVQRGADLSHDRLNALTAGHPYFAYGSNLCAHQMASLSRTLCAPRPAVLSDHNWLINQRGVATVEPFAGNKVHGVLWQLSERDPVRLDSAEGVPVRYRRERLTVHTGRHSVAGLGPALITG